jgi:hypothetical protein
MNTSIQDLSQQEICYVSGGGHNQAEISKLTALSAITAVSVATSIALDGGGGLFLSVVTSGAAGVITAIGTAAAVPLALPVAGAVASAASGVAVFYLYRYWFAAPPCKCS